MRTSQSSRSDSGSPGQPRARDRAVLLGERRPVRVLVVHGLVPGLALELREVLVAERVQGGRVGVVEPAGAVDDPDRLGDLREDLLALAQRLLGAVALLDVGERDHGSRAGRRLDRRGGVGHREHRPVAAHEPVLAVATRRRPRAPSGEPAVLGGERRPVRVLVVDRLVAAAAEQLGEVVVAERRDGGRVGEHDRAGVVDDPDGLGDAGHDRLERRGGVLVRNRALDRSLVPRQQACHSFDQRTLSAADRDEKRAARPGCSRIESAHASRPRSHVTRPPDRRRDAAPRRGRRADGRAVGGRGAGARRRAPRGHPDRARRAARGGPRASATTPSCATG